MDFAQEPSATPMVWMRHGDGTPGQIPEAAAEAWELRGWERCDAPPAVNPVTHPDLVTPPAPPAEPTTDGDQDADTSEESEN